MLILNFRRIEQVEQIQTIPIKISGVTALALKHALGWWWNRWQLPAQNAYAYRGDDRRRD
jgi:hypothetical protein